MTVTDEMVRAARRKAPKFWRDYADSEEQMRQVLTAALAVMWRPIEQYIGHQAILGWSLDGGRIVCFRDVAGQLHAQPGCVPLKQHIPTHFMPLPAPPATEVEG